MSFTVTTLPTRGKHKVAKHSECNAVFSLEAQGRRRSQTTSSLASQWPYAPRALVCQESDVTRFSCRERDARC
jgi:hypothetical protein